MRGCWHSEIVPVSLQSTQGIRFPMCSIRSNTNDVINFHGLCKYFDQLRRWKCTAHIIDHIHTVVMSNVYNLYWDHVLFGFPIWALLHVFQRSCLFQTELYLYSIHCDCSVVISHWTSLGVNKSIDKPVTFEWSYSPRTRVSNNKLQILYSVYLYAHSHTCTMSKLWSGLISYYSSYPKACRYPCKSEEVIVQEPLTQHTSLLYLHLGDDASWLCE